MPVPFPVDGNTWDVPLRPMIFRTRNLSYAPLEFDGVSTPTLTVTTPTVADQELTFELSAFTTFGDTGNQSSQFVVIETGGVEVERLEQNAAPFGPWTVDNFSNISPNSLEFGNPNILGAGAIQEQGTTWPPTALPAVQYSAFGRQLAFDATNVVPNVFRSLPSPDQDFVIGQAFNPVVLQNVPDSSDDTPTFTIDAPTSVIGSVHTETRWKVWQKADDFGGATPAGDPRTDPVFNNVADFDVNVTTGDLLSFTFPNDLLIVGDADTTYTVGVQCTFTFTDATGAVETFRSPYVTQQFVLENSFTFTVLAANNNTPANEQLTLQDMFTADELASGAALNINIENGAIVGSTDPSIPAMQLSSVVPVTGPLTVINNGTIIGAGGVRGIGNGGAGGPGGSAFVTLFDVDFTNTNTGTITGGGGGGGAGGNGGNGSVTTTGGCYPDSCRWSCKGVGDGCQNLGSGYFCNGTFVMQCEDSEMCCTCCAQSTTTTTTGGAGGAGGEGAGYNQTASPGSPGSNGGQNAGTGGNGSNGGAVAQAGTVGSTGASGNAGSGTAGGLGGTAGFATEANGNALSMTNNGTINGAQI